MSFSVNVLTAPGQAILAAASSANRVIYTRVITSPYAMTASEAGAASISDFSGPQGNIVAASATDNVARIVGSVINTTQLPVSLKSFALCARLENDNQDVIVMVLSDASAAIEVPAYGGPDAAAVVGFSVEIDAGEAGMVSVTSTASATLADLERFVSTHKAGDAYAGEAQLIRGKKEFLDELTTADLVLKEDPGASGYYEGSDVRVHGFQSGEYYGLIAGYCNGRTATPAVLNSLASWNACMRVRSKGFPDSSIGKGSDCSIRLATRDNSNVENCYVNIAENDGAPSVDVLCGDSTSNSKASFSETGIVLRAQDTDSGVSLLNLDTGEVTSNGVTKKVGSVSLTALGFNGPCHITMSSTVNANSRIELISGQSTVFVEDSKIELDCDNEVRIIADDINLYSDDVLAKASNSVEIDSGSSAGGAAYSQLVQQPTITRIVSHGSSAGYGDAEIYTRSDGLAGPEIYSACGSVGVLSGCGQTKRAFLWSVLSDDTTSMLRFEKISSIGTLYPASGSAFDRCDLGTASQRFRKVYADDHVGTLNGVDSYYENAAFIGGQGGYPTGAELSSAPGASIQKSTFLDFRTVAPYITAGYPNNYQGADATLLGVGSLRLAFFILNTTLTADLSFSPGTVYDSDDTAQLSNPAHFGSLSVMCLNGTDTSWVPSLNLMALSGSLTGKWILLNGIFFESGSANPAWALVLVVKAGMANT
jgi:hypothetical protein